MSLIELEQILNENVSPMSDDFEEQMWLSEYFLARDLFGWSLLPNEAYRDFVAIYSWDGYFESLEAVHVDRVKVR